MTTTMLFYKNPVLLNREAHRSLRLKPPADGFAYASACNAVPLTSPEFVLACREYPIVFVLSEGNPGLPFVMTGLRDEENVFVDANGKWNADYLPAFVRRYPFLTQDQDEEGGCLVMLDEGYPGFNAEEGEPLFGADGSPTPMLSRMIEFLEECRRNAAFTESFMERLVKYDLLVPHTIEAVTSNNVKFTMQGFSVVDEARLAKLSDAQILELVRSGDLGRIHAHLLSLNNVDKLSRGLDERLTKEAEAA